MKAFRSLLLDFARDRRGATAIEYTLITGLVSLTIIAGATQIGQRVLAFFQSVAAGFN